jgi:hypothetical protein
VAAHAVGHGQRVGVLFVGGQGVQIQAGRQQVAAADPADDEEVVFIVLADEPRVRSRGDLDVDDRPRVPFVEPRGERVEIEAVVRVGIGLEKERETP